MPVPSPRNSIRIARGSFADLDANSTAFGDGEFIYAIDQDRFYTANSGVLVAVGRGVVAVESIDTLADVDTSTIAPGIGNVLKWDGVNWVPSVDDNTDAVTSVNTQVGDVVLDADDIGDAATTNKFATQAELDKLAGIETGAQVNTVDSVAGKTGDVTLVKADITDFSDSDYATAAQGLTADSAVQPLDNVSTLTNDAGYITLAEVPGDLVTSVQGQTGDVVLGFADVGAASTAQGTLADSAVQPGDNVSALSGTTDDLSEGSANLYSQWGDTTNGINYAGGNVGIGVAAPEQTKLQVEDLTAAFSLDPTVIDYTAMLSGGNPQGEGLYGASLGFSRIASSTRTGAVISSKQTSTDVDHMGLAFLTHESGNTTGDLVEQVLIKHDGDVLIGGTLPSAPSTTITKSGDLTTIGTAAFLGTVGIGTSTPQASLEVKSDSVDGTHAIIRGTKNAAGANSQRRLKFFNPGNKMAIQAQQGSTTVSDASLLINPDGGDVGIGTEVPGAKLDVAGDATFSGDVSVSDNTKGLVLKSPDGTSFRLSVANDGTLSATSV